MLISISNFKGIKVLNNFPVKRITVLTGANSGGKSSIIHLLLLIKQSLESKSNEMPLKLNKPYVSLGKFESIVRRSSSNSEFSFSLTIESHEIPARLKNSLIHRLRGSESPEIGSIEISVSFRQSGQKIVVSKFSTIIFLGTETKTFSLDRNDHGKSYKYSCNDSSFFLRNHGESPSSSDSVTPVFNAFFPTYLTIGSEFYGCYPIDAINNSIGKIFEQIRYIGPLREEPRQFYFQEDEFIDTIGNKGENAPFVLYKHYNDLVSFDVPEVNDAGVLEFKTHAMSLIDALNYWVCERFQMAKSIDVSAAKTSKSIHSIEITNFSGARVPITHVGFGVSQILPILIEGLRPSLTQKIVILEQPEIHLHPKIQSLLFDFILSVRDNTFFIIETHSDHLINRLRRRVAESDSNELVEQINLLFSTTGQTGSIYDFIKLNHSGGIFEWPVGFFDQYESDLQALIKAQANKRKRRNAKGN